ncbi:hypothetical protein Z043_109332, partial [Scleropages formosus]
MQCRAQRAALLQYTCCTCELNKLVFLNYSCRTVPKIRLANRMASFNAGNGEVSGGAPILVEVGPDIHICGICKQQYNNFEVFLAHKQSGCHVPSAEAAAPPAVPAVTDSSTEFVFEETYQTCIPRGVKKIQTKAQKTPSKKLKPALTSKRRSCCFSGCSFKTQYGQKDMERHLKTHT